jgi:protein-tyrosine phosphatase
MAEFVMKELVRKAGLENEFLIESAATSTEEIGNDIHYGARQKLIEKNIPFTPRAARQITESDYDKYDYLFAMDAENIYYMNQCWYPDTERKIRRLMGYAGKNTDIADPWYTGNFDRTYDDILEACTAFLKTITDKSK